MKILKLTAGRAKGLHQVSMPYASKIISAQAQFGQVCLWFVTEGYPQTGKCDIHFAMTGEELPPYVRYSMKFIDTVVLDGGDYVIHVFADKQFVN